MVKKKSVKKKRVINRVSRKSKKVHKGADRFTWTQAPSPGIGPVFSSIFNGIKAPGTFTPRGIDDHPGGKV